ncbi:MAG TPA: PIG-L deacetylase family protein [Armatimonadota bacterium]|jgi:LmbE family N-acetylglucosaminyl deacetylase
MLDSLLRDPGALRALCVAAHCDDETLVCGGLLARITAGGGSVRVLALCGNEAQRRDELTAACTVLGCWSLALDYTDNSLGEHLLYEVSANITEAIRDFQPHLLITHDPEYDYNPEHRFLANATVFAAQKAGMAASGWRPELLISGEVHTPLPFPDYLVDISAVLPTVLQALACHTSQLTEPHKRDYYTRLLDARARWRGVQAGCDAAMAFRRLPLPVIGDLYAEKPAI